MLEWPRWMKAIAFSLATTLLPIMIVVPEAASWVGGVVASEGADASIVPGPAPPAPVPAPPLPVPVAGPVVPVVPVPLPPVPLATDELQVPAVVPTPPLPTVVVV